MGVCDVVEGRVAYILDVAQRPVGLNDSLAVFGDHDD